MKPRIVESNEELFSCYHELIAGDIILGRIRLVDAQEHLLLDLVSRGIHLLPPATAQLCSRSKVYQAALLGRYMANNTLPVYSMHDMMAAVTGYGRANISQVVCKLDRANAGLGILRFSSVEDVYSQAALGNLTFPFVLQPFIPDCQDVRVVILGDTIEAYQRYNPHNFRHNLHCGGESLPWDLSSEELDFCLQIMARSACPYGHVDLLILPDSSHCLSEINLRGGLRGASMSQKNYLEKVAKIQQEELDRLL